MDSTNTHRPAEVVPLSEADYSRCFETFCSKTTEYVELRRWVPVYAQEISRRHPSKRLSVLSIGAGTGEWDGYFLGQLEPRPALYTAIEPNEQHMAELRKTMWEQRRLGEGTAIDLRQIFFDEKFELVQKYELVLFTHCLYCIPGPACAVEQAIRLLSPVKGAEVLVQLQPEAAGAARLWNAVYGANGGAPVLTWAEGARPVASQSANTDAIIWHLKAQGIEAREGVQIEASEVKSELCVTEILKATTPEEERIAAEMMGFLLQTWAFSEQPAHVRKELQQIVKDIAVMRDDGTAWFSQPTGIISVRRR